MRPLLPDDGISTEGKVFTYPTSTEVLGRGIDVGQNGKFFGEKTFRQQISFLHDSNYMKIHIGN